MRTPTGDPRSTLSLNSEQDLAVWTSQSLRHGISKAPRRLGALQILLYRNLARRDARRYGWPAVDSRGETVAVSLAHVTNRNREREALLTERLEVDVAPVRNLAAQCVGSIEAALTATLDVAAQIEALPPVDYTPGAGETNTDEAVVRSRRDRQRTSAIASLNAKARQAEAEAERARFLLACADEALQERWELHLANLASWRSHRDRLGYVITRAAARRHPDPTEASRLISEALEDGGELTDRHPWSNSTTFTTGKTFNHTSITKEN